MNLVQEHLDAERLRDEGGKALPDPGLACRAHQEQRDVRRLWVRLEAGLQGTPIHARHHQVRQNEVRRSCQRQRQRLLAIRRAQHGKVLIGEDIPKHQEDVRIVVDDKDPVAVPHLCQASPMNRRTPTG